MLADQLYPGGFHPYRHALTPDLRREAKPLRRRDVMPMRYYFIDFGISTKLWGTPDIDVPELRAYLHYEAFPTDIFILGNIYSRVLVKVSVRVISACKYNNIVVNSNT